jgi:hypothetical protein
MGRLNQIEIRESELTYSNQREWFFHVTGHHVRELLMHFIGRDFILDGSSKFCAIFGERDPDEEICSSIFGVTSYQIVDFDIEAHMSRTIEEQQESLLTALTDSLVAVAESAGSDAGVIRNAAFMVRENGFRIEIPVRKLARSTRDRQFRVEVIRCLGAEIGEVWELRVFGRDGVLVVEDAITENPDHLDRRDQFSRSAWSGNTFQISSGGSGALEYSFDLSPYVDKSRQQ